MKSRKSVFFALLVLVVLCPSSWASDVKLPQNMVWSCYDVGSSGYVQVSAVANAFLKKYDIRVRLMPSGTSIGRLMPLTSKRASVAFLGNEAFFASQGIYDFAAQTWGPQDLRAIMGIPTSYPMVVTKTGGIKEIKDLKGKRVAWVVGNPSLNIKTTGVLAFANLTWNDVQKVEFPSYADSLKALIIGNADAAGASPTASILYELESSANGISHLPLHPDNKEGWKRLQEYVPFAFSYQETVGAGIKKEEPLWTMGYRYPIVTVTADADPEFVANLIQALDETYPLYKDAAASMPAWDLKLSGDTPIDVPFHPEAIEYLKKKGLWNQKNQTWNDERASSLDKVKALWKETVAESKTKNISEKDFPAFWQKKLNDHQKQSK